MILFLFGISCGKTSQQITFRVSKSPELLINTMDQILRKDGFIRVSKERWEYQNKSVSIVNQTKIKEKLLEIEVVSKNYYFDSSEVSK